jgi:hypothetical protein
MSARKILGNVSALPITIMPVDAKAAESAGLFNLFPAVGIPKP